MDIIIAITAILSVVNLFLLVALLLKKTKTQGGENDKLSDVRNAALINSIDRAFSAQNRRIDDMTFRKKTKNPFGKCGIRWTKSFLQRWSNGWKARTVS